MDIISVRYLLSALLQAVATAWAVVMAVHFFLYQSFEKRRLLDLDAEEARHMMRNEAKWRISVFSQFRFVFIELVLVSILAWASIVLSIQGLFTLAWSSTIDFHLVELTMFLSGLTFTLLAIVVITEIHGSYRRLKEWGGIIDVEREG